MNWVAQVLIAWRDSGTGVVIGPGGCCIAYGVLRSVDG